MCVRCDSPVAIVWHDIDKTDKQAVRAELRHRRKLLDQAEALPDKVGFKAMFVAEADKQYYELVVYWNETFAEVYNKETS